MICDLMPLGHVQLLKLLISVFIPHSKCKDQIEPKVQLKTSICKLMKYPQISGN
ncbi:hypothetical protein SDC9_123656 [bioreactor metagenome]|uniref:Uncharacterized protein n=1 Tax=bioreactor metagenome TaxID=1076179 RepID=A0A645CI96_9ZZZZ